MLFRGDFRVKMPFASITAASARDGVLTLKSTEGVLTLAIGAKAEKWAAAIAVAEEPDRQDRGEIRSARSR